MLEELGIPYENIPVRPASKAARKHVTTGKVPILLEYDDENNYNDDDASAYPKPSFVLSESSAIVTYLAMKYGKSSNGGCHTFVPSTLRDGDGWRERAIYDQTVACITNELDSQGLWIHQKHHAMARFYGEIPQAVEHAKQQFDITNRHLAQQLHPYLLGDSFSAVDILYVHCLDWSQAIGWDQDWPSHLQTYHQQSQNRPAYQKVRALRDAAIIKERKHKSASTTQNRSDSKL
jgi:glutathione S-transferase